MRGRLDRSEGERRAAERPQTSPSRRESNRATIQSRSSTALLRTRKAPPRSTGAVLFHVFERD